MSMKDAFKNWLIGAGNMPFIVSGKDAEDLFVKVPRGDQFIYLYHQRFSHDSRTQRAKMLDYEGLYNKTDGMLYDPGLTLRRHFTEMVAPNDRIAMGDIVQDQVRQKVEQIIEQEQAANEYRFVSPKIQEDLNKYQSTYMNGDVRSAFLEGKTSDSICYWCDYHFGDWSEQDLLEYIASPNDFVDKKVAEYIEKPRDHIDWELGRIDLIRGELEKLEEIEDSPLHRIKSIMNAAKASGAKKLTVTICKNGETMTFKTDASELKRDPVRAYGRWNIDAKERAIFEQKFGRGSDYTPEEIVDISYCGKSIYSAEPYEPEQTVGQGLSMKM